MWSLGLVGDSSGLGDLTYNPREFIEKELTVRVDGEKKLIRAWQTNEWALDWIPKTRGRRTEAGLCRRDASGSNALYCPYLYHACGGDPALAHHVG